MTMQGTPIHFMHINKRTTSQTYTTLPECDKIKTWCYKFWQTQYLICYTAVTLI